MKKKLRKKNFHKFIFFSILIIAIYSISLGYGLLKQNLSVSGTATITYTGGPSIPSTWDSDKVYGKEFDDGIVPIPLEFYYVTGNLSTGVVISDSSSDENNPTGVNGNQFVWIPVTMSEFTTTEWKDNAPTGSISSEFIEPFTNSPYPRRSF